MKRAQKQGRAFYFALVPDLAERSLERSEHMADHRAIADRVLLFGHGSKTVRVGATKGQATHKVATGTGTP